MSKVSFQERIAESDARAVLAVILIVGLLILHALKTPNLEILDGFGATVVGSYFAGRSAERLKKTQ